jgi:hypothetical protein
MSSSATPVIALYKPVPGTAEPFRVSDFNGNMDKLDAAYGTIAPKLTEATAAIATITAAVTAATTAAAAANAATNAATAALAAVNTQAIVAAINADAFNLNGGTA